MSIQRVERAEYLQKLLAFQDKQIIKVITGVRRCGKSTLMEMFQEHLKSAGVQDDQIIAINFEDFDDFLYSVFLPLAYIVFISCNYIVILFLYFVPTRKGSFSLGE